MFDELIKMAQQQLGGELQSNHGLDSDKANDTAGVIGNHFMEVIKSQAGNKDFSSISEFFSGSVTDASHPSIQNMLPDLQNKLQSSGFSMEQASGLASTALPVLFNMFNDKVGAAKAQGIDIQSLIQQFSGGGMNFGNMGSLFSMAGGFLKGGKEGAVKSLMDKFMK